METTSFDINNFFNAFWGNANDIIDSAGNLYSSTHGQPIVVGGTPSATQPPAPAPAQNNTLLYVGIAVVALLILIAVIFLLKNKA